MKKFLWIPALFITLALILTSCPGDGEGEGDGDETSDVTLAEAFPDTVNTTSATIVLNGNNLTVTPLNGSITEINADLINNAGFDASMFTGFEFEYRSNIQANIGIQDAINHSTMWKIGGGWGAITNTNDEWVEMELDFSTLVDAAEDGPGGNPAGNVFWGGDGNDFDKFEIFKIWIGSTGVTASSKIEIRNFSFILDPLYVPPTVLHIEVVGGPSTTAYELGDTFSSAGLEVEVTWNNGRTRPLYDYTLSAKDENEAVVNLSEPFAVEGTITITVSFQGQDDTFTIEVGDLGELEGITILSPPNKTHYRKDEAVDLDGLEVQANYEGDKDVVLAETRYTFSINSNPWDGETIITGTYGDEIVITVTFEGKIDTFTITVEHEPLSIPSTIVKSGSNPKAIDPGFVAIEGSRLKLTEVPYSFFNQNNQHFVEIKFDAALDITDTPDFVMVWNNPAAAYISVKLFDMEGDQIGDNGDWDPGANVIFSFDGLADKTDIGGIIVQIGMSAMPNDVFIDSIEFKAPSGPIEPGDDAFVLFDDGEWFEGLTPTGVTVDAGVIKLQWNPADNEGSGAYRGFITIGSSINIADFTKFNISFTTTSGNNSMGTNISLEFTTSPANRRVVLSNWSANSSPTTYNLYTNAQGVGSWAAGFDETSKLLTGIEIFSPTGISGNPDMHITKIWFDGSTGGAPDPIVLFGDGEFKIGGNTKFSDDTADYASIDAGVIKIIPNDENEYFKGYIEIDWPWIDLTGYTKIKIEATTDEEFSTMASNGATINISLAFDWGGSGWETMYCWLNSDGLSNDFSTDILELLDGDEVENGLTGIEIWSDEVEKFQELRITKIWFE